MRESRGRGPMAGALPRGDGGGEGGESAGVVGEGVWTCYCVNIFRKNVGYVKAPSVRFRKNPMGVMDAGKALMIYLPRLTHSDMNIWASLFIFNLRNPPNIYNSVLGGA